jgi:hypothetical protein
MKWPEASETILSIKGIFSPAREFSSFIFVAEGGELFAIGQTPLRRQLSTRQTLLQTHV